MDTELVARLRAVIPRLARVLNDTSTGEDLPPTQYSVLALVRSRGPLGLAELTELEGLNPTMVSRIIKVLDERELIRRMPDPHDLRAARLGATPPGAPRPPARGRAREGSPGRGGAPAAADGPLRRGPGSAAPGLPAMAALAPV